MQKTLFGTGLLTVGAFEDLDIKGESHQVKIRVAYSDLGGILEVEVYESNPNGWIWEPGIRTSMVLYVDRPRTWSEEHEMLLKALQDAGWQLNPECLEETTAPPEQ